MQTLNETQAAQMAYDSTAKVRGANGTHYLISCWHYETTGTIMARAAKFYEQEMAQVEGVTRLWMTEKEEAARQVKAEGSLVTVRQQGEKGADGSQFWRVNSKDGKRFAEFEQFDIKAGNWSYDPANCEVTKVIGGKKKRVTLPNFYVCNTLLTAEEYKEAINLVNAIVNPPKQEDDDEN